MIAEKKAMKKVSLIGVSLVMMLVSCGAATERADTTNLGEKQKVERSAPGIEDRYTAEDVTKAAAAANHEVTLEVLNKMSGDYATLLGNCQLIKYQQENGAAAMDKWMDDFVDEVGAASSGDDAVWVQEAMIKEGYSCTFQEMNQVAISGTLGEQ
jgi:hypothetical protein